MHKNNDSNQNLTISQADLKSIISHFKVNSKLTPIPVSWQAMFIFFDMIVAQISGYIFLVWLRLVWLIWPDSKESNRELDIIRYLDKL